MCVYIYLYVPLPAACFQVRSFNADTFKELAEAVKPKARQQFQWNKEWLDMGVSENRGTPKSSILIGISIINHPFWGTTIFGNTHIIVLQCSWGTRQSKHHYMLSTVGGFKCVSCSPLGGTLPLHYQMFQRWNNHQWVGCHFGTFAQRWSYTVVDKTDISAHLEVCRKWWNISYYCQCLSSHIVFHLAGKHAVETILYIIQGTV